VAISVNGTCPIKRRTRGDMHALRAALVDLLAPAQPVTMRQAFYLAVTAGLIAKTEQEIQEHHLPPAGGDAPRGRGALGLGR
jgi:hypothetical protein